MFCFFKICKELPNLNSIETFIEGIEINVQHPFFGGKAKVNQQRDREAERPKDRNTERKKDRKTERDRVRQRDRNTKRQKDKN